MAGTADDTMAEEQLLPQNPNDTVQAPAPPQGMAGRWRGWSRERKRTVIVDSRIPRMTIKGKVQNDDIEDTNNTTTRNRYVAFRGIPYAAPPIEDLRFQATQPLVLHKKFFSNVVWKAYEDKQPCVQRGGDKDTDAYGAEDCLYLNIYMPREPKKFGRDQLLPVLVFFHGGDHEDVTPDSIVKHDLIFVTVNYRMGPIGFLNMQTQSCRGNMGLKDQTQALRWIQDNIKRFKGDRNNVTISGHGAGASCVNFHLISPLSTGLFHKAIVSGGGIFCPFGFKGHRREFQEVIKQVTGKEQEEEKSVEVKEEDTLEYKARKVITDLFMRLSPEEFITCANAIMDDYVEDDSQPTELTAYLGPSIEIEGKYRFLDEPINAMMVKATPVPILAGIAKNEGNQVYVGQTMDDLGKLVENDEHFSLFLQQHFQWTHADVKKHIIKIKEKYFGLKESEEVTSNHYPVIERGLVDLHTDISHRRFYDNFLFGLATAFPPEFYVYEFDYYDDLNERWHREWQGTDYRNDGVAGHGDELLYLYCPRKIRDGLGTFNADVQNMINEMCTLWANFCKTGTPNGDNTPTWRPHTNEDQCYLHIGKELKMIDGRLNQDRWDYLNALIGVGQPKMESLLNSPTTPEPPSILTPHWKDPETETITDTWEPKPVRKGSGASSALTRRSSKSSSRRASHRTSISSTEHAVDPADAGMSIAATARNFGVGMIRRFSGYRIQPSESAPDAQPEEPPEGSSTQPEREPSPQPGPSSAGAGDIELQPLQRQSAEAPPESSAQQQTPRTPSHLDRFRQQQLQTPGSPSSVSSQATGSEHDDSTRGLIRGPRPSWWTRFVRRRLRSAEPQESRV